MAEREKGADRGGALARGDEAPRHEVNGGDVVGVERMAQAERVGQRGGGDELGVKVQHDAAGGPDEGVDEDEHRDGEDAVVGDAAEEPGLRGKLDVDFAHLDGLEALVQKRRGVDLEGWMANLHRSR